MILMTGKRQDVYDSVNRKTLSFMLAWNAMPCCQPFSLTHILESQSGSKDQCRLNFLRCNSNPHHTHCTWTLSSYLKVIKCSLRIQVNLSYAFLSISAMISYNVIIGDTVTKIIVRIGGRKLTTAVFHFLFSWHLCGKLLFLSASSWHQVHNYCQAGICHCCCDSCGHSSIVTVQEHCQTEQG